MQQQDLCTAEFHKGTMTNSLVVQLGQANTNISEFMPRVFDEQ